MEMTEYIKPELLLLVPVLYFIGAGIKHSGIRDNLIPVILGIAGVVVSALWVFATSDVDTIQRIMMAVFTAITQGILCAGCSVYVNQLLKQGGKKDE